MKMFIMDSKNTTIIFLKTIISVRHPTIILIKFGDKNGINALICLKMQ
jgi:hypothetical protein